MVKASPWNHGDRAFILGDAAHSVVPFFGQGANCAFEDALAFCEALDAADGSLAAAVPAFCERRRPATDALAALSLANYVEMRHTTATLAFAMRKRLDGLLQWALPSWWMPRYSMVSFSRLPSDEVVRRAERQDAAVQAAVAGVGALAAAAVAVAAYRLLPGIVRAAQAALKR